VISAICKQELSLVKGGGVPEDRKKKINKAELKNQARGGVEKAKARGGAAIAWEKRDCAESHSESRESRGGS